MTIVNLGRFIIYPIKSSGAKILTIDAFASKIVLVS